MVNIATIEKKGKRGYNIIIIIFFLNERKREKRNTRRGKYTILLDKMEKKIISNVFKTNFFVVFFTAVPFAIFMYPSGFFLEIGIETKMSAK